MYRVVSWDTNEILGEYERLATAKRYCRGQGHTGVQGPAGDYAPIAYVADEEGYLIYNPQFGSRIRAGACNTINTRESDCF